MTLMRKPLIPAQAGIQREVSAAGHPIMPAPGRGDRCELWTAFGRAFCAGFPPARERAEKIRP